MIDCKFTVDAELFYRKMGDIATKVIPYAQTTAMEMAKKGQKLLGELTPRSKEGGTHIADLWDIKKSRKGMVEEYMIHNLYKDQDILLYLEEGTDEHTILPRVKKCLRWFDGGQEFHAKSVHHPGTRPYKMVERVGKYLDKMLYVYINATFKMVDKVVK